MKNEQLISILSDFGCSNKEALIYIDCLKHYPSPIQEIAARLELNRVTVHSAVEQLLKKGFLTETREGKRRLITAEPPQVLEQLVKRNEDHVLSLKTYLDSTIQSLMQIQGSQSNMPMLRFYRGVQGLRQLLNETLASKTELLVFIDIIEFEKILSKEYLHLYYKRRAAKGIKSRLLWPNCKFAQEIHKQEKKLLTEVRVVPQHTGWKVGMFYWNDFLGIKSLTEGELTCTIIQNKEISQFYKTMIFEPLWKTSSKPR